MRPCLKVATLPESLHSSYYGKNTTAERKSIRFDTIEIREYARTVGDNPSCSSGPPLTIDWIYDTSLIIPVKEFEENRPPRRTYSQLIVGGAERQEMLLKEWNIPKHEVVNAIRSTIRAKNQRRRTLINIGRVSNMEEVLESVGKKLKQTVLRTEKLEAEKLYKASLQCADNQRVDSQQQDLQTKEPKRDSERTAKLLGSALRRIGTHKNGNYDLEKPEDREHDLDWTSDDPNNADVVSLEA
jgi:hypothetical protein